MLYLCGNHCTVICIFFTKVIIYFSITNVYHIMKSQSIKKQYIRTRVHPRFFARSVLLIFLVFCVLFCCVVFSVLFWFSVSVCLRPVFLNIRHVRTAY
jgi:hypothetical protein